MGLECVPFEVSPEQDPEGQSMLLLASTAKESDVNHAPDTHNLYINVPRNTMSASREQERGHLVEFQPASKLEEEDRLSM